MPSVFESAVDVSITGRQRGPLRGEPTGEVFCPQRLSSIAVMRCGEYQEQFKCQFGCPNAAKAVDIGNAKKAMRQLAALGIMKARTRAKRRDDGPKARKPRRPYGSLLKYDRCISCGENKSLNPSRHCRQCNPGAGNQRGRKIGRYDHCAICGKAKPRSSHPIGRCCSNWKRRTKWKAGAR